MSSYFQWFVDSHKIGWLTFDIPGEKVNTVSMDVLKELSEHLDRIKQDPSIKALVIASGKEDVFIAGANLHDFEGLFDDPKKMQELLERGHGVYGKLAQMPMPTFALIQGVCLGGGMELALACTYRIVTDHPKTILGLPEVSLGIIPGWGGTQRMPRLVGLMAGLDLILSGKPVKATKAYKMHLADAIVAAEFRHEKATEFILKTLSADGKKKVLARRKPKGWRYWLLESNPIGRAFVFESAKRQILKKTKGHYPSFLVALDVIRKTCTKPLEEGLKLERQEFLSRANPDFENAKNLVPLFFIQEDIKKNPGVTDGTKPLAVHNVGVIGGGTMGSGIAWLLCDKDYTVRLKDISWDVLGKGFAAVQNLFKDQVKRKKMTAGIANNKFHHLSGTVDYSGFQHLDFVIEAATENLDLKLQLFRELEQILPESSIIASNTSSLRIAEMAKAFKHPGRFVGMHFFNPPSRMPLVEVIRGESTDSAAVATAVDLCKKLGKVPLVVKDCPGFLVNRVFAMGANEILWMLLEGVPMEQIESSMVHFGMPMAPFVLFDEVGNDVFYKAGNVFEAAYGERMHLPPLVKEMYEHHLYGKKVGKGFYLYQGDRRKGVNPEVIAWIPKDKHLKLTDDAISKRVMVAMINEAARCLEEQVIQNAAYLDMALVLGIGFPPFRGGLLRYADSLGIPEVITQIQTLASQYGKRFEPCDYLLRLGKERKSFYKP